MNLLPDGLGWNVTTILLAGWLLVDVYILKILWPVRRELARVPQLLRKAIAFLEEG